MRGGTHVLQKKDLLVLPFGDAWSVESVRLVTDREHEVVEGHVKRAAREHAFARDRLLVEIDRARLRLVVLGEAGDRADGLLDGAELECADRRRWQ